MITDIVEEDGKLLCSGRYWNLDENTDVPIATGEWDISDYVPVKDIEEQINMPGGILEFNKKQISNTRLGFFNEGLNLTESYNVPHDVIKRVVIKYVKENGYIRGDWNGRYPTESPTVHNINNILRQVEDLEEFECSPEELEEFNNWVLHVQPEGAQADWVRRCIDTWNKESDLNKEDLRNMVSFVSYKFSNDAYNRRQELKRQRDLEHQQHVESETNTWAGNVGDTVSFIVQEANRFATMYGTLWNCKGTDGRIYTFPYQEEVNSGYKVTGKITKLNEFRGIKQTHLTRVTVEDQHIGFFHENLQNDWVYLHFGIPEEKLIQAAFDNSYVDREDLEFDKAFRMWHRGKRVEADIVNPFLDEAGISEFHNVKEACEYYGEEFIKEWISHFIAFLKANGKFDELFKPEESSLGFFK